MQERKLNAHLRISLVAFFSNFSYSAFSDVRSNCISLLHFSRQTNSALPFTSLLIRHKEVRATSGVLLCTTLLLSFVKTGDIIVELKQFSSQQFFY
jgi:hypothetical protein